MDIYATAILISIIIYILVGGYAGRKVKHLEDYFVVGRQAPTLLIVGTLVASYLSTGAFLGDAGFAYAGQAGSFIIWPPVSAMGYVVGALFFGRYLRRSRALTVADYFGQRFKSRRVQTAAGITIVLALGGYLLVVTQGAAIILSQVTELSYTQSLCAAWASYTFFTLYSGSRGVVITDTLMFLLFSIMSFVTMFYIIGAQGGWMTAFENLINLPQKAEMMSWHGIVGPGTEWETPTTISSGWSLSCLPGVW